MIVALVLGDTSGKKHDATPTTTTQPTGPLPAISVEPPPNNPAAAAPCTKLLGALPVSLNGLQSRPALSTSPFVVAWGDPAVVLRCGVSRPHGLVPGADTFTTGVDDVWYWVDHQKKQTVFTVIDRAVYIEVAVPETYAGGPLAGVSAAVTKTLAEVCVVDGAADPATQCTHRP